MRQTVTISLSPALKSEVHELVNSGLYSSTSELFRDAIRALKETILIKELKDSKKRASKGEVYKLTSLKNLA